MKPLFICLVWSTIAHHCAGTYWKDAPLCACMHAGSVDW